jgi:hypothetical protein
MNKGRDRLAPHGLASRPFACLTRLKLMKAAEAHAITTSRCRPGNFHVSLAPCPGPQRHACIPRPRAMSQVTRLVVIQIAVTIWSIFLALLAPTHEYQHFERRDLGN